MLVLAADLVGPDCADATNELGEHVHPSGWAVGESRTSVDAVPRCMEC